MARLGQFRGDTLKNWEEKNDIIPDREFILIASDSSKPTTYDFWVCGDGITHFKDLPRNGNGGGTGIMTVLQSLGDNTELPMSQEAVTRYISEYIVSNYHINPATGKNIFTALEAINLVPIYIRRLGLKCGYLSLVDPAQEITKLVMIQYIGKSLSESDWTNLNNWTSIDIQAESSLTVFIFKISATEPATPTGGYWNTDANVVIYPEGWTGTDFSSEGDIVWMSVGVFGIDGNLKGEWSKPIRVTGENGTDGTDGSSIEFIYKLTKTDKVVPTTPDNRPNESQYVPEGWTNHPTGISLEMQIEWVCIRTKQENSSIWSNWSTPVMWSKYGVNGKDGDGVEYIYKLNNTGVAPDRPTEVSQEPEFVPAGWTDNPSGVSASNKYEWVSVRKFRDGLWGEFSNPALWAKYGDNGQTGNSARTMYCKTASASNVPKVNASDINPGSIWGVTIPSYSGTEVIWGIQAIVAYDNTLVQSWQGPYLITGVNGKDGTPPNYKTYVFKLSDSKPSAPTSNDPDAPGGGWVDYPNQEGNWWQCVGTVNGVTGLVTEWGEVIPLNGRDGTAQDGKFTEFRFAKSSSDSAPSVVKSDRNPSGWTTSFPTISNTEILWMIKAVINPDNTLYSNWEGPIRISGEKGPQGNTGPAGKDGVNGSQGVAGIPGVDIELRFSLGTDTTYDATWNNIVKTTRNPTSYGWSIQMPTPTDSKLYIWLIQARIAHQVNGDAGTLETGSWSTPIKLNGTNGLPGPQGKKGQVVYPAGVYGNTVSYTTTETKAPYVYDPSDGNFYVLNAIMTWLGTEQDNRTPSQDYASNNGKFWLKFEAFEAVYAKIGIIANGLIGSAVFNGDYMFSQQGIDESGTATTAYEDFGTEAFTPNIELNFKTGAGHLGAGQVTFEEDGSVKAKNLTISEGRIREYYKAVTIDDISANPWVFEDGSTNILYTAADGDDSINLNIPATQDLEIGQIYTYKITNVTSFRLYIDLWRGYFEVLESIGDDIDHRFSTQRLALSGFSHVELFFVPESKTTDESPTHWDGRWGIINANDFCINTNPHGVNKYLLSKPLDKTSY